MSAEAETPGVKPKFDFDAFPAETLFYERRDGSDRRVLAEEAARAAGKALATPKERRAKKDRRRRIDPTTFEKQYTDDELEFMSAMQRFKVRSGKTFPSHGEVLRVIVDLGYRKAVLIDDEPGMTEIDEVGPLELVGADSGEVVLDV